MRIKDRGYLIITVARAAVSLRVLLFITQKKSGKEKKQDHPLPYK